LKYFYCHNLDIAKKQEPNKTSMSQRSVSSSGFEGVKVSKGFVRGLQGQVLKLEQTQQSLITQLEHANALAAEFHDTSVMYQRKYDEALHQMEEMRREHGYEKAILIYNLEAANEDAERERELNQEHSQQIILLEHQLVQQSNMTQTIQSQATTIAGTMDMDYREELSPVSLCSLSPRMLRTPMAPRAKAQTPTFEPETPETPIAYAATVRRTPSSFRFQFSPAMASCDGLYAPYVASEHKNEPDSYSSTNTEFYDDTDWEQKERED
jgi:hypothetical protein